MISPSLFLGKQHLDPTSKLVIILLLTSLLFSSTGFPIIHILRRVQQKNIKIVSIYIYGVYIYTIIINIVYMEHVTFYIYIYICIYGACDVIVLHF